LKSTLVRWAPSYRVPISLTGRLFELRKSVMNPSIPFLALEVTVSLLEPDAVGGETDAMDAEDVAISAVRVSPYDSLEN
jgi:hypothetical protein